MIWVKEMFFAALFLYNAMFMHGATLSLHTLRHAVAMQTEEVNKQRAAIKASCALVHSSVMSCAFPSPFAVAPHSAAFWRTLFQHKPSKAPQKMSLQGIQAQPNLPLGQIIASKKVKH
jgi:hypothetical protein